MSAKQSRNLQAFMKRIPDAWGALGALAAALTLGFVAALWLVGFVALPETVAANTDAIRANVAATEANAREIRAIRRTEADMEAKLDRIICHLEEQRKASPSWERCER